MKYLKIHIVLWWLICLIMTGLICFRYVLALIVYFIWTFKIAKYEHDVSDFWLKPHILNSPKESFYFYFHYFKKR